MSHSNSTPTHHDPSQMAEPDSIDVRSIIGYGIGLTVIAAIAHIAMVLMFNVLSNQIDAANPPRVYPLAADEDSRRPPEPRLQGGVDTDNGRVLVHPPEHNPGPKQALQELRAEEDVVLNGYEWVDRNAKIVRIPIDQAMKLTLQRGLPAREAQAAQSTPAQRTQDTGKEQGK